ncbi:DegQ family serine endoprotease [Falsirhodobacter sp. 20TX0035]|uniref:DegQ family serine endoprotease n=1 Tax=Falsirhodobacter sp. 20TX0035 TaxID=3022019 RepID=UPI00232F9C6B|nr:DegQ family serine endoprotease [Falsirhodobacter sp. 20TX0035]MDB6452155.1 DegQ family serine endoprotease [Falsirhodobacter sp. 20TX0035]
MSIQPKRKVLRAALALSVAGSLAFGSLPLTVLPAAAQDAPPSFADLAQQISPSVVNITTTTTIAANTDEQQPIFPPGSPFEDLFRDFMDPRGPQPQRPQRSEALGSGFIISEDGYIVTNNHVIENADDIQIETFTGKTLKAKLIGTDKSTDIALLKVESPEPLPFVPFGDSDHMRVGDWVLAMGNPLGQGFSASSGIVSARNRALSGTYDDFIQTDAAINRGNSGGPLFNMDGQVIGVNTAILSPNGGSIGIGFSMASNVVQKVVDQLREFGETRRGWLGVQIQDVTPDVAEAIGLDTAQGALITDVPEGPARDAGIQSGDVVTSFAGQEVKDTRDLVNRVADAPIGEGVPLTVLRDGKTQTLNVTLGRREEAQTAQERAQGNESQPEHNGEMLGLSVTPLNPQVAQELGLEPASEGLAITGVDEMSDAFTKGVRAGDVITEANQEPVATVQALEQQIKAATDAGRKSVLLLIRREGQPRFVALPINPS